MNFDLLTSIVESYKKYELTFPKLKEKNIIGFAKWVLQSQKTTERTKNSEGESCDNIDVEISKGVVLLYRYARTWIKKGMDHHPELINEDFTYLYSLIREGNMTKTQLIAHNLHEKSSGMEIIKRLLALKIIEEKTNENDRRSKELFVTDKGNKLFQDSWKTTQNIARLITGNLDNKEKEQLVKILNKLHEFHNPLFLDRDKNDISTLLKK
jgi:DNA-binding MarR family transcriptional regulator